MSERSGDNAKDHEAFFQPKRQGRVRAAVIETAVDVVIIVVLAFAISRLPNPSGRIIAAAGIGLLVMAWAWGRWLRLRRLPRHAENADGA